MRVVARNRVTLWFWKKRLQFSRVAQPNESRLSCGAEKERSQIKDYHNEPGRRQLQARVRPRPALTRPSLPLRWAGSELARRMRVVTRSRLPLWFWKTAS